VSLHTEDLDSSGVQTGTEHVDLVELEERYADELYREGSYARAALQYRRLYSFFPDNPHAPLYLFRAGISQMKCRTWLDAVATFERFLDEHGNDSLVDQVLVNLARCNAELGESQEARRLYHSLISTHPASSYADDCYIMVGVSLAFEKRWREAGAHLENMSTVFPESSLLSLSEYLADLSFQGNDLPERSPLFAALLSGMIPGSGQIYSGRFWDGVSSFLINALLGYANYRMWEDDDLTGTCFFGWLGATFYLGNIYGGFQAAKYYSREQQRLHYRKIEEAVEGHMQGVE
jgi:tetratricopeptide (TPR) repeat protein